MSEKEISASDRIYESWRKNHSRSQKNNKPEQKQVPKQSKSSMIFWQSVKRFLFLSNESGIGSSVEKNFFVFWNICTGTTTFLSVDAAL